MSIIYGQKEHKYKINMEKWIHKINIYIYIFKINKQVQSLVFCWHCKQRIIIWIYF